jgi:hypothetical protein
LSLFSAGQMAGDAVAILAGYALDLNHFLPDAPE